MKEVYDKDGYFEITVLTSYLLLSINVIIAFP
jgi:hypothetical protein